MDGAGNDFVVIDNRDGKCRLDDNARARLCNRRTGIGADGLMTLNAADDGFDFGMTYYNSDGKLGSMCGNGGRCIAMLACRLGMGNELRFHSFDGEHRAKVEMNDGSKAIVSLSMRDVAKHEIRQLEDGIFLNTGSPHYVVEVNGLRGYDVDGEGRRLRNRVDLFPEGANIDFVERFDDGRIAVRTYERGVEAETLSCGTGVTASAIVSGTHTIETRGGLFNVTWDDIGETYMHVCLKGPASLNYIGEWISSLQ